MHRPSDHACPFVLTATDGTVTAFRRDDGATAWTFRVPDGYVPVLLSTRLFASERDVVLVAAREGKSGGIVHVVCLDIATGTPRWRQELPAGASARSFTATLLVDAGQIFLALSHTLTALSLETGAVMWQQPIAHPGLATAKLSVAVAVPGSAVQGDARQ